MSVKLERSVWGRIQRDEGNGGGDGDGRNLS